MKKLIKNILVCSLVFFIAVPFNTHAQGPIKLEKGKVFTPSEDGWFFTVPQEKKLRFKLLDAEYYEKAFKLSEDTNLHLKKQVELEKEVTQRYKQAWLQSDESLTKVLKREQRTKLFYMILGIGLTVGAGFAMGAAAR